MSAFAMFDRRPRSLIVPLALFGVLLSAAPSPAKARTDGGFVVPCDYTHTLADDPIVMPGHAGMSHSHDFFGNISTNAQSTYPSMLAAGTKCALLDDTAGYWLPTPSMWDRPFHPQGRFGDIRVYYKAAGAALVEPIPPDLEMIGGNRDADSPLPISRIHWYCGAGPGAKTPFSQHPYDCTPYAAVHQFVDGVVGVVNLPRCWNGTGITPSDVVYPVTGTAATCPEGHGHLLPQISERVHFGIMDPCGGMEPCGPNDGSDNVVLSLASGPFYTLHADFWNTWQPESLDVLITKCLNLHQHCGFQRTMYPLAVAVSGTGVGTVRSEPHGISCGSVCSHDFGNGGTVTLTAASSSDSSFAGWGGACQDTRTATCTIRIDGAKTVTAAFQASA
jgi:hypothetical protein